MDMKSLLGAISQVNSAWSIAAFSIAAILGVLKALLTSEQAVLRRGKTAPRFLYSPLIWPFVVAICVLGALPIAAHTYLERERIKQQATLIYRVRVTVLDPQGVPTSGTQLRTTASNETTETRDGAGVVMIPRGSLPSDGKVTIFADLASTYLHGRVDLQLADDPNPSVTIELKAPHDAVVTGLVEDEKGRGISGAAVSVLGGESGQTSAGGIFTLKTNAAIGQMVRLHVEKAGYRAVDQDHPAGREAATIVLRSDRAVHPRVTK